MTTYYDQIAARQRFQGPSSNSASSYPSYNRYREPEKDIGEEIMSRAQSIVNAARRIGDVFASIISEDYLRRRRGRPYPEETKKRHWAWKMLTVVLLLQVTWVYTLYWGERSVYSSAIEACDWRYWEHWPASANPHHMALIADPQLVDPHTYPGRPWPLSTLTVHYTDLYLRRVFLLLQKKLYPDTTIFLGDLFDGGREWSVNSGVRWDNPDKQWKNYGESFWHKEYLRFQDIFLNGFEKVGVTPRAGQSERRKLIASLPGNHDLGFGHGVHLAVRERFEAYFGEGNRVDIIGNHSFISVDGVSLSARDYEGENTEQIWGPTASWLRTVGNRRIAGIAQDLKRQFGEKIAKRYEHSIVQWEDLEKSSLPNPSVLDASGYPAVLLSHVPLYRDPETPCGPLREKNPQSRNSLGHLVEKDPKNSILVQAGYQYQNVLSGEVTLEITSQIGDVRYAFSGDDHDYCEVRHMRFPSGGGGIREVTVKTLSWAMGIRKPGFQLVSLWNPIDEEGLRWEGPVDTTTLESKLCLLPDQLGIFVRYGMLFVITLIMLAIRARHLATHPEKSAFGGNETPILPLLNHKQSKDHLFGDAETSSSDDGHNTPSLPGRRSRAASLMRTGSPAAAKSPFANGNGKDGYFDREDEKKGLLAQAQAKSFSNASCAGRNVVPLKGWALFAAEMRWSMLRIVIVALPLYVYLLWVDGF